jgi:hypothetical protein
MQTDRRTAMGGAAAALLLAANPVRAAETAGAADGHDGRHDFDFLIGDWTVRHRSLRAKPGGGTEWMESSGTCALRTILGGTGNLDDNLIRAASGAYRGATLRMFDPAQRLWSIWWLDSRDPTRVGPPIRGGFKDGTGVFLGDDELGGKPIRVRITWSDIAPTNCRWSQAYSSDGGERWETNWIMDFTRA